MILKETEILIIKIIIVIIYAIFCLVGLPLIFIFPPRKFLFKENNGDDENKKYLFQNFAAEIYDNINKPLINNITLTKDNKECPNDYETLEVQHQYYGKFTQFYRNSSICIKRNNKKEWSFREVIAKNETKCESMKKSCGIINRRTNILLCIYKDERCPLNDLNYDNKPGDPSFEISNTGVFFNPQYDQNENKPLIIDVDFIYKYDSCLEKFQRLENIECEFVDNDECFIKDNITSNKIDPKTLPKELKLIPNNLIQINIQNDNSINHNYCPGVTKENKAFETFVKGFVDFNEQELNQFLEEFPEKKQDPLSQICETYKSDKNLETLFYYFACILFCWSFLNMIILILMFFLQNQNILILIHKIFKWNSFVLFIFKLICFGVLLVSHYDFYLNFKDVFLEIANDYRNEILKKYKDLRIDSITKILVICLVGFILILVELIIMAFVMTILPKIFEKMFEVKRDENNETIEIEGGGIIRINIIPNQPVNNQSKDNISENSNSNEKINLENEIDILLMIKFNDKEETIKHQSMKVRMNETFNEIESRLKAHFSEELENKKIYFKHDSNLINKLGSIQENNIKNGTTIIVDVFEG